MWKGAHNEGYNESTDMAVTEAKTKTVTSGAAFYTEGWSKQKFWRQDLQLDLGKLKFCY